MEKYTYKLKTVSSLIVSPRANLAYYNTLEGFYKNQVKDGQDYLNKDKLKIIYPFYQYGEYESYNPGKAVYYIPGSTIKGALCQDNSTIKKLMADDVMVKNDDIILRNLYKVQYLDDASKTVFEPFFDNVGVEMVNAGVELEGEIYANQQSVLLSLLEAANKSTQKRMMKMIKYLDEPAVKNYKEEVTSNIQNVCQNLADLLSNNNTFLFEGYKGLLHSLVIKDTTQLAAGTVFLDPAVLLPHGLVKIELAG